MKTPRPILLSIVGLLFLTPACDDRAKTDKSLSGGDIQPFPQQQQEKLLSTTGKKGGANVQAADTDVITITSDTAWIVAYSLSQPEYDTLSAKEKDEYDEGYSDFYNDLREFAHEKHDKIIIQQTGSRFILVKDSVIDRKKLRPNYDYGLIFVSKTGNVKIFPGGLTKSEIRKTVDSL
jgi:hypothetical protein